jgi:hypothetical protein
MKHHSSTLLFVGIILHRVDMNIFPDLVTARLVRKPPSHHQIKARQLRANEVHSTGSISKCGLTPGRTQKMMTQFSWLTDFIKDRKNVKGLEEKISER